MMIPNMWTLSSVCKKELQRNDDPVVLFTLLVGTRETGFAKLGINIK